MSIYSKEEKSDSKSKLFSSSIVKWEHVPNFPVDFAKDLNNGIISFRCFKEPDAFEKAFLDLSEHRYRVKMVEILKKELE